VTTNPLVAAPVDAPKDFWAGVWIAEDIELVAQGVRNGSWVDGTLGVVGAGLDALALVSDPAGALLQYGVAWMIEHIRPLTEALDWLAGDPAEIQAHAQTWRNVSRSLQESAAELADAVRRDVAEWGGSAGPAYRSWSKEQQDAVIGLAKAADTMAVVTEGAGMLIAAVRLLVRDAIATVVSRLIVYAAELAGSLGFATPLVVEQATTLIASWAGRIAHWLRALVASLRRLLPVVRRLGELVEELRRIVSRIRATHAPTLMREGDGIVRNGKKILMTMDNVKAVAAKYGIDLNRVRVGIDKSLTGMGPGKELFGYTRPDGKIILSRDAFMTEEELARTLAHERFHLDELRNGLPFPYDDVAREAYEERAKAFERQWWEEHKHLLDG
jgi:uncharacterized protein YukE